MECILATKNRCEADIVQRIMDAKASETAYAADWVSPSSLPTRAQEIAIVRYLLALLPLLIMSGCASGTVPNAESSTERDVPFAGRRVADNLLSLRLEANKPVTSSLQEHVSS